MPRTTTGSKIRTRKLLKNASYPTPTTDFDSKPCVDLCDFCLEIIEWIANPDTNDWTHEFKLHAQSTCQFCEKIIHKPEQAISGHETPGHNIPRCLKVWRMGSSMQSNRGLYSRAGVEWIFDKESPPRTMQFALWAEKNSPAAKQFVVQPPILGPSMEDVCHLAHHWLHECRSFHTNCRSTSGRPLPTRVLQLSGSAKVPVVRLIETKNLERHHYCALSHCWGPVDKQPLRTTRKNYQHHLSGIPFEQLPISFRDTVLLARGLHINYVWIDSLCIIQDDKNDWRSEAKKMGQIYQNATLVVAAAGAHDSTIGLFVAERPFARVRKLPYITDGVTRGSFNMALLPEGSKWPQSGALNKRAWALQERHLARRTIHFMPGQIFWKCKESEMRERSDWTDLGFNENRSWLHLLELYSKKKLTQHQDRIYALRGIIDDMQKNREDDFLFDCGVWEKGIHKQILWRQKEPTRDAESLDFPTWSWASVGGSKDWCLNPYYHGSLHLMPKYLRVNGSRSLDAAGELTNRPFVFDTVSSKMHEGLVDFDFQGRLLLRSKHKQSCPSYVVRVGSCVDGVTGIVVFDRDPPPVAKFFFVARTTLASKGNDAKAVEDLTTAMQKSPMMDSTPTQNDKDIPDMNIADADGKELESKKVKHRYSELDAESNHSRQTSIASDKADIGLDDEALGIWALEESGSAAVGIDDESIIARLLYLQGNSRFVYWALLLEPVGKAKYKRVGLAMLYPHVFKILNVGFAEFKII